MRRRPITLCSRVVRTSASTVIVSFLGIASLPNTYIYTYNVSESKSSPTTRDKRSYRVYVVEKRMKTNSLRNCGKVGRHGTDPGNCPGTVACDPRRATQSPVAELRRAGQ